ncbi:flavin reductase (DIM6/NTAB) family NADH-FMN oxidoreductase RutF [Nocardia tenerifensis]|uniref:Flavin reductase (DIM6/NTAB) family NADH-FMN oxidoreductase RutF n=1 Tax=Nocardia tenerifensis TaxID=228006 RepID=A0A318KF73_9NOCA|nr:flavin reductase family protein [Nocardia tenerifensis]PXX71489.1 flavin reductase (DIM6/NTAB) family NADH-FMN oxidoreductase RutF [Nocardia tenerifensis]
MFELNEVPSDGNDLRGAFACFPSGVVAVCAELDGLPLGLTVSTFVPVSLDPPLVSFCVQNSSRTWPRLVAAGRLGVSLLGTGQQRTARALAARTGDRFRDIDVHRGHGAAVFIDGASAWIEGSIDAEVPGGDHTVVLLRIHRLATRAEVEPLVFHGSRFRRLHA